MLHHPSNNGTVLLCDQLREVEARYAVAQEEHEESLAVLRIEAESAAHEAVRFHCLMDDGASAKPDTPKTERSTSTASTDRTNKSPSVASSVETLLPEELA